MKEFNKILLTVSASHVQQFPTVRFSVSDGVSAASRKVRGANDI